jgi:hypothetical protein
VCESISVKNVAAYRLKDTASLDSGFTVAVSLCARTRAYVERATALRMKRL